MALQLQTVAIIRQRGQLTIPDSIKKKIDWVAPGSVVTVAKISPDQITIRPFSSQKTPKWSELWKQIKRVRSFKGRVARPISLSEFIVKDRQTHF